jgi:hypothetical protein
MIREQVTKIIKLTKIEKYRIKTHLKETKKNTTFKFKKYA